MQDTDYIPASDVLPTLHQFLLIFTHTLLYHRRVYPPSSFQPVRFYDLVVRQNRHPGVCEWIQEQTQAAIEAISKHSATHVSIAIFNVNDHNVCEQYTLALDTWQGQTEWGRAKAEFAAALVETVATIQRFDEIRKEARKGEKDNEREEGELSFTITVEIPEVSSGSQGMDGWIVSEKTWDGKGKGYRGKKVRPIRYVDAGGIGFNLVMEKM